ncbi:porin family protein [Hymenobacter properus]|uniref:PorT family protein n=1 Tax=Hymenobacter properus TaxID=2791026 RepID=A0A931BEH0_9BACT|nr:porin family protein [Hymenobacter properus]MBF9142400.1 PorT family protein [Hymenobacter properus]MBR7721207.1 PorT family protein [Microvirga sp. SRT04]
MKKPFLLFLLTAGTTAAVHAQETRFGIKAGGTLSTFVGKDATSTSGNKLGFHAGLVANLGLNDRLSIQPELLYSMKGTKDEAAFGGANLTGYQTLHYLDVPVVLKAKFSQLFLEVGPQAGVLIDAKATVESGSNSTSQANKATFNDVDLGYVLGLGFQADSGPMVGFRYNGAFTNAPKSQSFAGRSFQAQARNSALQLYIGFLFGGK